MSTNVQAELAKQVRRPAHWLLLAIAAVLTLTFAYLIPYAAFTGTASGAPGSDRGLDSMLPGQFIGNALAGTPIFAGALALVAGVLVAGSEYGWETWKTVLTQGPGRLTVYTAKLVAVAAGALLMVLVLFGVAATASSVVAAVEGRPLTWPSLTDLATGAGAGWLVLTMWAVLGMVLGIGLRGVALPIGLGLVWMLAVQNLLSAIAAPLLDWVAELQKALPGPNVGSLVADLGANEATPGVGALVGAGQATMVVAAYLLVFAVLGGLLLQRRDVL